MPIGAQVVYAAAGPLQIPGGAGRLTKTCCCHRATPVCTRIHGAVSARASIDGGETVDLTVNRLFETRLFVVEPTAFDGEPSPMPGMPTRKTPRWYWLGQFIGIELVHG